MTVDVAEAAPAARRDVDPVVGAGRARRLGAECALVALVVGAFDLVAYLLGRSPLANDALTSNLPLKHMAIRQWSLGHLPLWDSGAGAGVPLLADSIALPLDPRNLWFAVLDRPDAYFAVLLTGRLAGAVVCFAWLRRGHRFGFLAALAGTCAYVWSTMFFEEFRLHSTEVVIAAFPAVVWLTERLQDRPGLRRAAALAGVWSLVAFAGSVAYLAYLPACALLWGVARWAGGERRRRSIGHFAGWYVGAGAAGAALAAVVLLPTAEFALRSNRGGEYLSDPYWARSVLSAVLGAHRTSPLVTDYAHFLYVGVVGLALVAVACGRRDTPELRALPWLGLGSTVAVLVMLTPLKPRLVDVVPQLATVPFFRLAFLPALVAAFLIAAALSRSAWHLDRAARAVVGFLATLQVGVLAGVAVLFAMVRVLAWEDAGRYEAVLPEVTSLAGAWSASVALLVALRAAGTLVVLKAGRASAPLRPLRGRVEARHVVAVLLVAELAVAWATVRRLQGGGDPYPLTTEVAFLRENTTPDDRIAQLEALPEWGEALPDRTGLTATALASDAPVIHGVATASLYESLIDAETARLYATATGARGGRAPNSVLSSQYPGWGLWDALGVRYLVSRRPVPETPGLGLVHTGEAYYVYERLDAAPRAFVTAAAERLPLDEAFARLDAVGAGERPASELREKVLLTSDGALGAEGVPGGYAPARVVLDEGSRVRVEADSPAAGWLVLSDTMMPGWEAEVNGRPVRVETGNGFARAVPVPEGPSTVTFRYRPASVRSGAAISVLALAALVGALVWRRAGRRPVRGVTAAAGTH